MQTAEHYPLYRHYKGDTYLKLGEALHTETEEMMVVYTSTSTGRTFCRPKTMFEETITHNGQTQPRFTLLKPNTTHA